MSRTHWNVFDAWTQVGRHPQWQAGQLQSVAELLDDMDHYGIAEAMVVDCLRTQHPLDANRRVLEQVKGQPRLHPGWTAVPDGAPDEQPVGEDLVKLMREHRVGALYLFPNQFKFNLSDWCIDSLLEPLAEARVPVVINPVEIGPRWQNTQDGTDWDGVVGLCKRYPMLPVIISEQRIRRTQRILYKALDACENLYLELSCYWLHRGIEYITQRWGAKHLVFGSGWPTLGPHMTLATLTTAEISANDKLAIAGDNWRALIDWCQPGHPQYKPGKPADEFVAFGRSGSKPKAMVFHDCHGHIGPTSAHYHLPDCDPVDKVVADMDRLGVERCCVFSFTGVFSDEQPGNDTVAAAVKKYPDRFLGFTLVNPHRGPQEMRRELERGQALGLRGVKLIPHYVGYDPEGPNIDVAVQWAHEHHQFILNHHWGSPAQMARLVKTYPNACFFTGHTTTAYAEIMKQHANLYVCSCPLLGPRACEDVVAAIGADRFLFGSDLEDLPIAWGLGPIMLSRCTAAEKALILGGNLKRLMEKYSVG